jgi:chromosome segregation ATPase
MSDDLDRRLKSAVDTRNNLAALVQKLQGRLESARDTLAKVEQECRDKGLDPDALDAHIDGLQADYAAAVASLEAQIASVQTTLAPFIEEAR